MRIGVTLTPALAGYYSEKGIMLINGIPIINNPALVFRGLSDGKPDLKVVSSTPGTIPEL
jgi:hypothetical protein